MLLNSSEETPPFWLKLFFMPVFGRVTVLNRLRSLQAGILTFELSIWGPDPSQTLNYGLQLRSVKFSASGVRQVSRSKI